MNGHDLPTRPLHFIKWREDSDPSIHYIVRTQCTFAFKLLTEAIKFTAYETSKLNQIKTNMFTQPQ